MRKSIIVSLLLVELTGLFIVQNIHSLMKNAEAKALEDLTLQAEQWADFAVAEYRRQQRLDTKPLFFDAIDTLPQREQSRETITGNQGRTLVLTKPVDDQVSLVFSKSLDSPLLKTISMLKRFLLWAIILLAIFLVVTTLYFLFRLYKERGQESRESLPPLQEYFLEMKHAQQEMQHFLDEQNRLSQQREELNKTIIANLHLAVILLNLADHIEIFNPAAEALFNKQYTLAKNNLLAAIIQGYPELLAFIQETRTNGSADIESSGRTFRVNVISIPKLGRLVLLRDISEERKRERIQRINSSLVLLGEMAAALAHEIKNSLGVMLGYARLLGTEKSEAAKIEAEITFLTQMMENFLHFAGPVEELHLQPCELREMLSQLAASIGIELSLPEGKMAMTGDPILLNRIFSNLLLNAKQAGAKIVAVGFEKTEAIEILLTDDGSGIPEPNRDKVWLPFFSTKEKGTGMGLPTVRKLVHALGGDIQLLQTGPGGTRFLLSFYPQS